MTQKKKKIKQVPPEEIQEMKEMFKRGVTQSKISKHFGYHISTIGRKLKNEPRPDMKTFKDPLKVIKTPNLSLDHLSVNQITLIKRLYDLGVNMDQVLDHFGVPAV